MGTVELPCMVCRKLIEVKNPQKAIYYSHEELLKDMDLFMYPICRECEYERKFRLRACVPCPYKTPLDRS